MAPSPEYDKEPKAPDKSATNISSEDSKLLHNLINDQHHNSDHKTTSTATISEVESNKHVETLDDDKLRALLNEALTYKCPKDREGKSSLFKELLEEVEQDDQEACEAAARTLTGCRGSRRGARGGGSRPSLPHSNSLQDLVAALAAEPTPRRHHRHHAPPSPATVAARAIHGGSLPSGVDTSSMLSEEGSRGGAGYLATVRCVNPPPLAERRVSASDANAPHDLELLNRRSKPMFPMTYTARATLEIGSGSVCSGRAVTTTTASNQVRTSPHSPAAPPSSGGTSPSTRGRLMSAICSETCDAGGGYVEAAPRGKAPRGPDPHPPQHDDARFLQDVDAWYSGLAAYSPRRLVHAPAPAQLPPRSRSMPSTHHSYEQLGDNFAELSSTDTEPRKGQSEKHIKKSLHSKTNDSRQWHSVEKAYRVVERPKKCDINKSDISLRKTYREVVKPPVPRVPLVNPRNFRNMSIGAASLPFVDVDRQSVAEGKADVKQIYPSSTSYADKSGLGPEESVAKEIPNNDNVTSEIRSHIESEILESTEDQTPECFQMMSGEAEAAPAGNVPDPIIENDGIELEEIVCHRATVHTRDTGSFSNYLANQEKLFRVLEATDSKPAEANYDARQLEKTGLEPMCRPNDREQALEFNRDVSSVDDVNTGVESGAEALVVRASRREERAPSDRYILAELPNNAYIFLTLPKRATPLERAHRPRISELPDLPAGKHKKKKDKPVGTSSSAKRKDAIDKNALRALLFENFLRGDVGSPPSGARSEVDSAIPFSCITTPEVVASCNTTASASHAPLAADPKPLGEVPRVASLTPAPAPPPATPTTDAGDEEGRSVVSSSLHGLPLSRPGCGATSTTCGDDYKKSLDENGNSVQGYGSPLSGSSQHKKPRRKKSSKNETVIDCRQIDGYQGDKDVNELLRFIESDRAPKLRKHKDDADDKGKKRSADRRKHHEHKPARASSLEELSRTTLEELTARAPPVKPERRSWGDAAPLPPAAAPSPNPPVPAPASAPAPVEQADFQTVTKKRKPRRRTEEAAPRRARAPSPRPPASAPPSDRSNDSNDDMESVHSLPERAPPHPHAAALHHHAPAPHASYADIARTRNNIPDLIESCNFYAEGESGGPPPRVLDPSPDADNYPALDARVDSSPPTITTARRTPRDKPAPAPVRVKERPAGPVPPPAPVDCPAPDVVADRRPPVILLDSASRPRELDGVTFGFDINEQLLGDGPRRPRCDLVRDAVEAAPASTAPPPSALPVRAAKRALRYVPPPPPPDHSHLNQIVDFVGGAWEDVLRSSGGKVRYFSE